MEISKLPKTSLYHLYHNHHHYNIGELMAIFDHLRTNDLLRDVIALTAEGTDEEIVAYETWRASVYNDTQSIIMGDAGNLTPAVLSKILTIYQLFTYPSSTENAYCLHVAYHAFMKGKIDAAQYAGFMGGHLMHLTFIESYIPWLNRRSQVVFPDIIEYPDAQYLLI